MWNERLAACAQAYPSGVLSAVDAAGFPVSVRCQAELDAAGEQIRLTTDGGLLGGLASPQACLLFHRHNPDLSGQHQLLIKGTLEDSGGQFILRPTEFLSGSGRTDTDRMPGAGSPWDIVQFMLLGRRKAREYLEKRGAPWPPRPWTKMLRYLDEGH